MADDKKLYQQILKSTTLFGGLQFFNIVISVVRTKAIALLIGTAGMGIAGLFNAVINVISGATSIGLETSAVKFISEAQSDEKKVQLPKIVAVLKKWVLISGLLAALLTIALAPWLSRVTFGSTAYTNWFIWLSAALFFRQLANANLAILQGYHKLKLLAKANFSGSLAGLLLSLPLYYYFKSEAIAPAIIISAAAVLLFSSYYSNKIKIKKQRLPTRQLLAEGKSMLYLGAMMSLAGVVTTLTTYVLQIYIGFRSDLSEVGLYNAGFTLLNSYVAIIFTAMGTDYFPRLAAVSDDNAALQKILLHQAQIAILVITPVIVCFLPFANLIIRLLYSAEFLPVVAMVSIGILGMLFRAVSWSMGYTILAKGDSKLFIRTAFGFNALFLFLNTAGYFCFGLMGLGIAFCVHYFLHMVLLKQIIASRYGLSLHSRFFKSFFICVLFCATAYFATFIELDYFRYFVAGILILGSCSYMAVMLYKSAGLTWFQQNKN